ncbi:2-keto-4-pentenoate hydratase [Flexivirga alba]|uniref:2-keto-4-pentenoate hydratase n=1 Tax=Flexivirga alba TaxID=702742 RepID=A0ABW2ABN4_9MICO
MTDIRLLARTLDDAVRAASAIPQLSSSTPLTLDEAYAVQRAGVELRRERSDDVVGVKLGFTSKAKAEQMGVSDVIIGYLTGSMAVGDGGAFNLGKAVHPRIEPEVAFRLGRDIDPAAPAADLTDAVDGVAPAMEIIDSRYRDFKFSLEDVVADNTSACGFVIGEWLPPQQVRDRFDLSAQPVRLSVDGHDEASGSTRDILGDPWQALPAVVRMAAQYGHPLAAGSVLLAGAATAAIPLRPGTVRADVGELGSVSVRVVDGGSDV